MKIGVGKPSLKKSLKARTTGKAKRAVKKAVVPGYGKKGMGWVKNPKKAAYNKVYNKTTVGINPLSSAGKSKSNKTKSSVNAQKNSHFEMTSSQPYIPSTVNKFIFAFLAIFLGVFGTHWFYAKQTTRGLKYLVFCWTMIPFFLGFYQGIKALFSSSDSNNMIQV